MLKDAEGSSHVDGRPVHRISSAVWPKNTWKSVSTGRAAQRRRDWIMHGRWWVLLADALSMRVLLTLTTLLVVISSLIVAVMGLGFWYLLLFPLLLFAALLCIPSYLASRVPEHTVSPGLASFAQEIKSSTGMLSLSLHEFRSHPGLPSMETPMPVFPTEDEQPLVRVLETYDLSKTAIEHFLLLDEETGKRRLVELSNRTLPDYDLRTNPLDSLDIPYSEIGTRILPPILSRDEPVFPVKKEGSLDA